MNSLGVTSESFSLDKLIAGDHPTVQMPIVITSGAGSLAAGTVLGRITTGGKYAAYDNGHSDGTEVARAILPFAVDATSADVDTTAYFHGEFNEDALTGIDDAGVLDLLGAGIYVKANAA